MSTVGFGFSSARASSADEWLSKARHAEQVGYEILHVPDHLGSLSATAALAAAAVATERIRLGAYVLNNDFRHPLLTAQEATTLDLLSNGRLELGLGAGWSVPEYEQAGITFEPAKHRIERLEEAATILRLLVSGEEVTHRGRYYTITGHTLLPPPPQGASLPLVIGGNGNRLLSVAGRHSDIVGFTGFTIKPSGAIPSHFSPGGLADRIGIVKGAAGDRFENMRLSVLVQHAAVTGDAEAEAHRLANEWAEDGPDAPSAEEVLASPFVLIGTVAEIVSEVKRFRGELGVTRFTVFERHSPGFDDVVRASSSSPPS